MNTKIITGFIALQFAMMMCFSSCSIKEDRSSCPCMLVLNLEDAGFEGKNPESIDIVGSGGFIYEEDLTASVSGREYMVAVPRSGVYLNVSNGGDESFSSDKGFVVADGCNFLPLFLYSSYVDTDCETVTAKVALHKEHCNVDIQIKAATELFPYSIVVRGDVCGVGLDGHPVSGPFGFAPVLEADGSCVVRVPRQLSSSLILEIVDKNSVLRTFAIGEYIVESGYDWTAENLEDVDVVIDYASTEVEFVVNGWEKTIEFDVEI